MTREKGDKRKRALPAPDAIVICLPTRQLGFVMNSFKHVHAFQFELEFGSVVGFDERGKPEYVQKPSQSNGENQQQTQPTCGLKCQNLNPGHIVGRQVFYHCTTLAPPETCF